MSDAGANIEFMYSGHQHQLILVLDDSLVGGAVPKVWTARQQVTKRSFTLCPPRRECDPRRPLIPVPLQTRRGASIQVLKARFGVLQRARIQQFISTAAKKFDVLRFDFVVTADEIGELRE